MKKYTTRLIVSAVFGIVWHAVGVKISHRIIKKPKESYSTNDPDVG